MLLLVANLGSTSFKFKLFDFPSETVLAVGAADRIGPGGGRWEVEASQGRGDRRVEDVGSLQRSGEADLPDHAAAVEMLLARLVELEVLRAVEDVEAIGFKAVHGGPISGAVQVTGEVLETMREFADVAPAHNPPYIAAMEAFAQRLPDVPQVAAFETAFHQTIPESRRVYAIPHEWTEMGVKRYGFHGASHRYIATRMREIAPDAHRVISLHLGGSCSLCAIRDGQSVANSFGMTAQSGVFHNNRVGDFDAFALLKLRAAGIDLDTIFHRLGKEGGLLGLSGVSADMRDVEQAADQGNPRARLAFDAFIESCRSYLGSYLVALGGADAIVFTGGIGQHGAAVRQAICANLEFAEIKLDPEKNAQADGKTETRLETPQSRTTLWILPTNEELIVARQAAAVLAGEKQKG